MTHPGEFTETYEVVSNWGRWGADDRIGTLNLIDPACVLRGRDEIVDGTRFTLAIDLESEGPQAGAVPGRDNAAHEMIAINEESALGGPFRTSDDKVTFGLQSATHWDGLAHVSFEGQLYNGIGAVTIDTAGSSELGIDRVGNIVSRAIIADVARARGVEIFEGLITGDDLDAALALGGVVPHPGDILLIRTGHIRYWTRDRDAATYCFGPNMDGSSPGPGLDAVRWFHRHDIAAVASDTMIFEVFPSESTNVDLGVHIATIVSMGLTQGQNWDLEALADACAADGRYTCMLIANPEPFKNACGAPVNPVAVR
ncbi:MAG: cyclase family protein [Acidobacteria bacterium]|nr:cyclase family protein [Acidobacteriota bacterium]